MKPVTRQDCGLWIGHVVCCKMTIWQIVTSVKPAKARSSIACRGDVRLASVIWSLWQSHWNAWKHVTGSCPAAGDQLLPVSFRLHGDTKTHSCFQRSFYLSQAVRNGPKQNNQKGSVSSSPVCTTIASLKLCFQGNMLSLEVAISVISPLTLFRFLFVVFAVQSPKVSSVGRSSLSSSFVSSQCLSWAALLEISAWASLTMRWVHGWTTHLRVSVRSEA